MNEFLEEYSCKGCEFYNEEDDICEALDCNVLSDCDAPLPCEALKTIKV